MPITDQDQIAASVKQRTSGNSLNEVTNEAVERVEAEWQNRGYFRVQVGGVDAKTLTSSPVNQRIALSVHVDEGPQFRLGGITFKHNKAITDLDALRHHFPINDGDIVSREKIGKGLENLRRAYGELGYINFTSVPNTKFEDDTKSIYLDMDVDEGKQFHMGDFNIVGLDEPTRQELLKDFPMKRGQVYDVRLFESFMLRHSSILPDDPSRQRRLDERAGTVAITLDASQCPD